MEPEAPQGTQLKIRISEPLRLWLKVEAAKRDESLSGFIVTVLEGYRRAKGG